MHRNLERDVAGKKRFLADASAFVADDECRRRIKCFGDECRRTVHRKTVRPEAFFFKNLYGVVYIADGDERNPENHAGRRLHYRAGNARLMVLRYEDAREAECGGGADNRADIMWVLHLAENGDSGIRLHIEPCEEIIKRQEQGRRVHDSDDALMHRALPDKLPPAAGGEFCNRYFAHFEKSMKRDIAQIGR